MFGEDWVSLLRIEYSSWGWKFCRFTGCEPSLMILLDGETGVWSICNSSRPRKVKSVSLIDEITYSKT